MMKTFMAAWVAILFTCGLHGVEPSPKPNSTISIGGNYTRSHIKPHALPSFEGNMGGMQGMYQYRPLNFIYFRLGTSWRYGTNHMSEGKRSLLDVDVHEWVGYTAALSCNNLLLTPITGFGFRHLSHHLRPHVGSSIRLRYNEFYIPVGLLTEYKVMKYFSMGLDAIWMPQVYPTLTINVIDGARWVLKNTYKNFNIALPFLFHTQNLGIILKPYFELWQDGRTTAKTLLGEFLALPKNTYTFWGVNLNLNYAF